MIRTQLPARLGDCQLCGILIILIVFSGEGPNVSYRFFSRRSIPMNSLLTTRYTVTLFLFLSGVSRRTGLCVSWSIVMTEKSIAVRGDLFCFFCFCLHTSVCVPSTLQSVSLTVSQLVGRSISRFESVRQSIILSIDKSVSQTGSHKENQSVVH